MTAQGIENCEPVLWMRSRAHRTMLEEKRERILHSGKELHYIGSRLLTEQWRNRKRRVEAVLWSIHWNIS